MARAAFRLNGKPIFHYMGTSTFANHTVVPEIALAKIRTDAPFDKVCYIGCGVTTGIGAVINTAKVEPGRTASCSVSAASASMCMQGLRMVGANMIVGVDMNDDKKAWGEKFGMTHFVNPSKIEGDLTAHLVELTNGGGDYTFECIGNVDVMRVALESAHKGWGESIIIGVAGAGKEISTRPFQLVTGRLGAGPHSAAQGANGCAEDRRLVHGRQNSDRSDDHPHAGTRRHQQGLRPDARRQIDPICGRLLRYDAATNLQAIGV